MRTMWSLVLSLILTAGAGAQVLPPDALLDGKTLGEWNAEFWKWLLPTPSNMSPALDPDGRWAHVGQPEGPVWFMAKVVDQTALGMRSFSVPEGKYLFAPLISVYWDTLNLDPPLTVEQLREIAEAAVRLITEVHLVIDGVTIPDLWNYRAPSPVFSIEFADPSSLYSYTVGFPVTGLLDPVVADGYVVLIEPLPPGEHVITFGGVVGPPFNLTLDFTDTITVVPIPLAQRIDELILAVDGAGLDRGRRQALMSSLESAKTSFDTGRLEAGRNQIRAFLQKVRVQVNPGRPDLASAWSQAAQSILERAQGEGE